MADPASYRPKEIPEDPGVYRFYNGKDKVIYVGKAKNLKNRLTTYFGSNLARKTPGLNTSALIQMRGRSEIPMKYFSKSFQFDLARKETSRGLSGANGSACWGISVNAPRLALVG